MLADVAAWIWAAASEHFPGVGQVLDIFHAGQHIAAAAAGLHGESSPGPGSWPTAGRG